MRELCSSLEAIETAEKTEETLREAAIKWAGHSLKTYNNELLHRAMAISEALAQFVNEYETTQ